MTAGSLSCGVPGNKAPCVTLWTTLDMEKTPQNPLDSQFQTIEKDHRRDAAIVSARPLLIRTFLGAWVVLDVALVVFFVVTVIVYLVSGSFTEMRNAATLGNNIAATRAISVNNAAEDLVVGSPRVLKSSETAVDFYVAIENPNDDWYATFDYVFSYNGGATESKTGYVMPSEEKYVITLNEKSDSRPSTADIEISNLVWHHVDRHDVADPESWLMDHGDFEISNATYGTDVELAEEEVGRSTFTVKNNSPYAYWEPTFTVILERNGAIVGLHQATVSRFSSGETEEVAVHWSGEVPTSATATLVPNINYFDADVYMSPSGSQGIDLRDLFAEE